MTPNCCAGTCRSWRSTPPASPPESTLWSAAGINAKTAQAYQALFQRMFVLDLVPAWFSNRIKRLVKAPKRYLVDPALVAAVLGLGRDAILYGPDMLGRLLDTFVAAQLRGELAASSNDPRLYHLREEQGRREVDLLIETAGGQLIGIEVKACRHRHGIRRTPPGLAPRRDRRRVRRRNHLAHRPARLPRQRPHHRRAGLRALVLVRGLGRRPGLRRSKGDQSIPANPRRSEVTAASCRPLVR